MQNPLARFQMFHPDIPMTVQFNKSGGTNLYVGTYDYDQYGGVPDKQAICIQPNLDSTGAVTLTFSGGLTAIPLLKANGTPVTNLRAGAYYNAKLNSARSAFILQGEGGSGNAVASDLLSGKTASTDAGDITGTMVNQSGPVKTGTSPDAVSGSGARAFVPAGYYDGSTRLLVPDNDLIAGNIKSGVNLFGLIGTLPDGTGLKKKVSGQNTTSGPGVLTVTGLTFNPTIVVVKYTVSNLDRDIGVSFTNTSGINQNSSAYVSGTGLVNSPTFSPGGGGFTLNGLRSSVPMDWIAIE
jgi:hypothetical protein